MQPRFHDRPDEAQDAGQNENAPGEASLGEEWNAANERVDDRPGSQNAAGEDEGGEEPARTWAQARETGGNGDTGEQPAVPPVTNGWPPPPPATPIGGSLAGGPFQGGPFDAPPPPGAASDEADRPEGAEQPEQGEELTPEEEARAAEPGDPDDEPAEAESAESADEAEPVEAAAAKEPAEPAEAGEAAESGEGAEPVPVAAAPATTPPVAAVPALAADREELLGRWREVQASFVDDPLQAVNDADDLVGDAVDALIARLNARRQELGIARQGGSADTEQLRQALRSYRDLLNVAIGS